MIYGAVAVQSQVPTVIIQAMSAIVFAGSSQFVMAVLMSQAAPGMVIVITAFILNLRHMFYSASVAPYTRHLSTPWKLFLAYLLTDEAYAVAILHYNKNGDPVHERSHWYLFGAGITLWISWQLSTAAGIFLGMRVPSDWPLDFALALTFIAILFPMLKDRPAILAAISAGLTAVLLSAMPYKLGLVVAAAVGIAVGIFTEGSK
jgi:4-azaleucine resistance transporter AzlC